ncbi:MAG: CotH kinase family protein [Bacteroidetes bacterium]|nr:CotH kinase family protein [Bacteroidota bacterium]
MRKKIIPLGILLYVLFTSNIVLAQGLYDVNTIQKIEITFPQVNWDYQMDTAKIGDEGYLMASEVKINGIAYDSVGVKYKGNSSYDSSKLKNPLHIQFDEFKEHKHDGYTDIKLSNGYGDPSLIREVLSYEILKNYMHCSKANFAQVYINGNYVGLYSSAENVDKNFCADHFYSSQNTFFKCNPTVNPGPTTKSNYKYINNDTSSYELYYELKSKLGWLELVQLCDSVTNNTASLENVMDMDRVIWMLAFNNLLVNLDSYSGVFAQNHYVYKDNTQHFNPIIWDLNMSFGAFPFAGAGATSMGALSVSGEQQFAIDNHATDTFWPLINAVQGNATYKKKYVAHMRTIMNEYFANPAYETIASQLTTIIDTAVQSDANKFYTYTQFQQAMDSSTLQGTYYIPGIKQLMNARVIYLQSRPEFTAITPVISSITSSIANPLFASTFTITANIANALSSDVWLAYRYDKTLKFEKVNMFDDGAHNDGAANDNVFGIDLSMQGGQMQYYIYAQNANAGIFSPERAEHEFHVLHAASSLPTAGTIVINELLASNATHSVDEYNQREDWIELYNTSSQLINLDGVFLSDDINTLNKWQFPAGTTIQPNGYITVWADDDESQQVLHTNFNLNKDSGILILSNTTSILDSISFFNQQSDTSFGRYPNGTGSFVQMNTTYAAVNNNYPLSINNYQPSAEFILYPNPTDGLVNIRSSYSSSIQVYTIQGKLVFEGKINEGELQINVSGWPVGVYFAKCGTSTSKLVVR